ncbi:hypothetical protein I4U23_027606 [Adineta vaga]|nr:hypothetical protein I4U23_027606 [Adineta vaga]
MYSNQKPNYMPQNHPGPPYESSTHQQPSYYGAPPHIGFSPSNNYGPQQYMGSPHMPPIPSLSITIGDRGNYSIVWLDSNIDKLNEIYQNSILQLQEIIQSVYTFIEVDESIDFITQRNHKYIFMIISNELGQKIVHLMQDISQVKFIYVFCSERSNDKVWIEQCKKIKGVFTEMTYICNSINANIRHDDNYLRGLTLTNDNDEQLKRFTASLRKEIGEGNGWHQLGYLMIMLDKIDQAEEIYTRLLSQTSNDKRQNLAALNNQLGIISEKKDNFEGVTSLETIPNELFVEIFSYLTSIDTIFAFSNLNQRFQSLTLQYCEIFDLNLINKSKCDFIFQIHNTNQWKSLRILDNDQKPFWIDHFIENYISIKNFSTLQFLSIGNLTDKSQQLFFSILPSLTNLISLSIDSLCGKDILPFDLPKLKKLVFGSCLSIDWIQNFTQLQTIEYTINHFCENTDKFNWPLTVKYLKFILMVHTEHLLILNSLVSLSQLTKLEIYQIQSGQVPLFGHRWEQLIHSSCIQNPTHTIDYILLKMLKLCYLSVFIPANPQSTIKRQLARSKLLTMECSLHRQEMRSRIQQQITRMVSAQAVFGLIGMIAYTGQTVYNLVTASTPKSTSYRSYENFALTITGILAYTGYTFNFYIYIAVSRSLRRNFKQMIKKCLLYLLCQNRCFNIPNRIAPTHIAHFQYQKHND